METDKKKEGKSGLSRRGFIGGSIAAAAGLGLGKKTPLFADGQSPEKPRIKEFRRLGRTGFKVSDIGFGAGYLQNSEVLEAALDAGINYIDTAEHYARGNSERTVGQVMKSRDRKTVFITTKMNLKMGPNSKEGLRKRFDNCLERLQLDYVDCLMLHMTPEITQITHAPYHDLIRDLKAEGKVRFTGLSNHGREHSMAGPTKDDMDKVVLAAAEDGRFDVVLFAYNFLQTQQGEKILTACRENNMGTTLMKTNPVKFYRDIENMFARAKERGREITGPYLEMMEAFRALMEGAEPFKTRYGLRTDEEIRDAAVKFCLNNPLVHTVCPSMNTFDELDTYLALSGQRLTESETGLLAAYERDYGRFYCRHACGLCEADCPSGVPVNTIMRYDHYFRAQRREKEAMSKYAALDRSNASFCFDCSGNCQRACPYSVPVQGLLCLAHQALTLDSAVG